MVEPLDELLELEEEELLLELDELLALEEEELLEDELPPADADGEEPPPPPPPHAAMTTPIKSKVEHFAIKARLLKIINISHKVIIDAILCILYTVFKPGY